MTGRISVLYLRVDKCPRMAAEHASLHHKDGTAAQSWTVSKHNSAQLRIVKFQADVVFIKSLGSSIVRAAKQEKLSSDTSFPARQMPGSDVQN